MDCSTPGFPVYHQFYSNSCPSCRWCHPTISSSVIPFCSCLQSFPSSESSPMSWLFTGDQSIGVSALAAILPMNTQGWFPQEIFVSTFSWIRKPEMILFCIFWDILSLCGFPTAVFPSYLPTLNFSEPYFWNFPISIFHPLHIYSLFLKPSFVWTVLLSTKF